MVFSEGFEMYAKLLASDLPFRGMIEDRTNHRVSLEMLLLQISDICKSSCCSEGIYGCIRFRDEGPPYGRLRVLNNLCHPTFAMTGALAWQICRDSSNQIRMLSGVPR
ncbi:hypothetical protein K1719_015504 [Acacia pycnantha]|nr:hypothetical protein K1719_015504 [Acacia pycnantha]